MHIIGYKTNAYQEGQPITIEQAARFQHTHVIGQTGTGKSTFARQSFMQDILAGHGGCYFDFHGQDAEWLLDHVPPDRIDDVIYFNPLDQDFLIGYNVLDGVAPQDYASFTDDIVATLRHIHHASWGARMDDILTNAIRPLFDLPPESRGTLLGVVRMLNDANYRHWVIGQTTEQSVKDFWMREYADWSKNDKAHNLNSSLNKIRRFQSSPILRNILGQQRSRINFSRAIADGQIIICDIDKWRMGAVNANTLSSLIVSRLIYEATRRDMPRQNGSIIESAVIPFQVVIDEFQTVTTLAAVEAFAGIRKYRVGFTICHQYAAQLSPELLDAVNGNVANKVVFRVGGEDALHMQRYMDISKPTDLAELDDFYFFAQYKNGHNNVLQRGYIEPMAFTRFGRSKAIRSRARAKFSLPVTQLEERYERWLQSRHYGNPIKTPDKPSAYKGASGMRSLSQIMRS